MSDTPLNKSQRLRISVLLSVNRALLGEIGSSVRGISCSWDDREIRVFMTYDKQISEEDLESAGCVEAEILADFPDHRVKIHCRRIDYPEVIPTDDEALWIFRRRES